MERRLCGVRNSKRPCVISMLLGIYTRCTRILFYWADATIGPMRGCRDFMLVALATKIVAPFATTKWHSLDPRPLEHEGVSCWAQTRRQSCRPHLLNRSKSFHALVPKLYYLSQELPPELPPAMMIGLLRKLRTFLHYNARSTADSNAA
jgi:hypothetical protein